MSNFLDKHPMIRQTIVERAWAQGQRLHFQAAGILDDRDATRIKLDLDLDTSYAWQSSLKGLVWSQVEQRLNVVVNYPAECATMTMKNASSRNMAENPATAFVDDVPIIIDEIVQVVWADMDIIEPEPEHRAGVSQSALMLIDAYQRGLENGGSMEWEKIDDAHAQALKEREEATIRR